MKKISLFLLLALCLFSCRNEMDQIDPPVGPDPKIVVNASVNGQILDSDGNALENATIDFNNKSTQSDKNGIFSFSDSDLFQDGTYITVHKDGYISGSRLFYPSVNETSHVIIQLIDKTVIETVSSSTGGKVSFDGASITLPANGFVNDDGTDYSGNVNIIAKWLNPEADATFNEMPGDLVGINTDNEQRALATYGMLAVELEDQSGNHLQIKDGFTADIEVPVPTGMQANAPSEIPLWHFDMESGYWVEEGSAQLVSGVYIGEVSHFSFWNCDAPFPLIQLSGTVIINPHPLENVKIRITDNSTGFTGCGYTTDRGFFTGKVPQNQTLTIEILDECGNAIFTDDNVGPFSSDTTLPDLNISLSNNTPVTISGIVGNCNGDEVENSYVLIQFDNGTIKTYATMDDGSFSFTIANCTSDEATVYGVDVTNDLISAGMVIDFENDVNLGTLEACEDYLQYGFIASFPGSTWTSTSLQDTVTATHSLVFEDDKKIYEVSAINWFTQEIIVLSVILKDGEVTANWSGDFAPNGFECSGLNADCAIVVNDLGQSFLTFSGTTTDITETDPNLFDPNITEVSIDFNITL